VIPKKSVAFFFSFDLRDPQPHSNERGSEVGCLRDCLFVFLSPLMCTNRERFVVGPDIGSAVMNVAILMC
jgi:hypothetical protein